MSRIRFPDAAFWLFGFSRLCFNEKSMPHFLYSKKWGILVVNYLVYKPLISYA